VSVRHDTGATSRRSLNQVLALAFGAVYTVVAISGFFVSDTFAGRTDNDLLGFQVNHLHNLTHLVIGLALLAASRAHRSARSANLTIGVVYLALAVLGPFIDDTKANVFALNGADHVLHLLSGALLAGVALFADKQARTHAHA
jgi:hypothetical protein